MSNSHNAKHGPGLIYSLLQIECVRSPRLLNTVLSAGCTLTLILITDWLLTVAGIGDSKAVLDLGAQFLDLSPEHRVHNHLSEQDRLKRAGSYLAPIRYATYCSRIHFGVDCHVPHACCYNDAHM